MEMNSELEFLLGKIPRVSACDLARIKPPYVHFKRKYPEYILYVVLSGCMELTEGDKEYSLKQNDILLLDPGLTHFGRKATTCDFFYLHFSAETLEGGVRFPKYYHMDSPKAWQKIIDCFMELRELFPNRNHIESELAGYLAGRILLLVSSDFAGVRRAANVEAAAKVKQLMPQLISYLQTSYNKEISGENLQERFNYNFDYLNRSFKAWTGENIFKYLTNVRIEKAKTLLLSGYYSVEEVANAVGFNDPFYFSKVFKNKTGMSPGKYRYVQIP